MKILFVNACVREGSRTLVLAREILKNAEGEITELELSNENIPSLDRYMLDRRDTLIKEGMLDDELLKYARQFAEADEIYIAAPFWDLSFPSILKTYIEQISVTGLTFCYSEGRPKGLCRAKRLVYITTAGGEVFCDFGYSYVKALATEFYGIPKTVCYRAANLDVKDISGENLFEKAEIKVVE